MAIVPLATRRLVVSLVPLVSALTPARPSSDTVALLTKEPVVLCLECHGAVEQKPHVIKGITGAGHPLGKQAKMDPKRPDRKFYCGSCHDPHSSDCGKLYRYPAKAKMALCINCHKFLADGK